MSRGNLRDHLENFYGEKSLSPETAERLRALAAADTDPSHRTASHRQPVGLNRLTGIAAGIALILSGASFYMVSSRDAGGRKESIGRIPVGGQVVNHRGFADAAEARYVAVKFQIDGCPRAAEVEPAFCEMVDKLGDKPVMFGRYDMTNAVNRRLSHDWACVMGIDWACQGAAQSGTILLLDRKTGDVVGKLTDRQQLPEMMRTLDQAMH